MHRPLQYEYQKCAHEANHYLQKLVQHMQGPNKEHISTAQIATWKQLTEIHIHCCQHDFSQFQLLMLKRNHDLPSVENLRTLWTKLVECCTKLKEQESNEFKCAVDQWPKRQQLLQNCFQLPSDIQGTIKECLGSVEPLPWLLNTETRTVLQLYMKQAEESLSTLIKL